MPIHLTPSLAEQPDGVPAQTPFSAVSVGIYAGSGNAGSAGAAGASAGTGTSSGAGTSTGPGTASAGGWAEVS